jgi:hypothetical protein
VDADYWNEFSTVRALCVACGWFRLLGYCGRMDDVRAVIRIDADASGCNLLRGRVLEYPPAASPVEWPAGYRDLNAESHQCGVMAIRRTFDALLKDRPCPRCKKTGSLCVDWYTMIGGDPLVAKMRT